MTIPVYSPQRPQNNNAAQGQLYGEAAGGILGYIYGGETPQSAVSGAQTGGGLGSSIGGAMSSNNSNTPTTVQTASESSPVMRRQQAIDSDPVTQMRQGNVALASMDAETRKAFQPVLDEGLRRAAQQRKDQYGYGYTGTQTA